MVKQPELDYEKLHKFVKDQEPSHNKLSADSMRHRMKKIAFDVYNIENDPYDSLWRLESNAEDGKEYLIRMDNDSSVEVKTGGWSALSNEVGNNITLAYKGIPIQRFAAENFGFSKNDIGLFKKALLERVSKDKAFKDNLLDMQSEKRKNELYKTFPELAIRK